MVWQVRLRQAISTTTSPQATSRQLTAYGRWENVIDSLWMARAGSTWCASNAATTATTSARQGAASLPLSGLTRTTTTAARRMNVASCGSSLSRFSTDAATETEAAPLVPGIGKAKTSTGLVGLPVDHEAIPKIIALNQALLDKMAASDMPETAQYRINVEAICRYRIQVCQEHPDNPEKVEELIDCGQVEELVVQAKDEMEVLDMYLENRIWELVRPNEVEILHEVDPMAEEEYEEEEEEVEGKDK